MNRLIVLNKMNTLYLTPDNTYVISNISEQVYEINRIDTHCEVIGWYKSLIECSEAILEYEKSVKEGLVILC